MAVDMMLKKCKLKLHGCFCCLFAQTITQVVQVYPVQISISITLQVQRSLN